MIDIASNQLGPSMEEWQSNPASSAFKVFNPLGPVGGALADVLVINPFGDKDPSKVINQEYGQLTFGGGKFGTSGGAWGPTAQAGSLQTPLQAAGDTIDGLIKLLGGIKDASKVWGVSMESNSIKDGKGWNFSNQTSYLVGPNGERTQWGPRLDRCRCRHGCCHVGRGRRLARGDGS